MIDLVDFRQGGLNRYIYNIEKKKPLKSVLEPYISRV